MVTGFSINFKVDCKTCEYLSSSEAVHLLLGLSNVINFKEIVLGGEFS